MNSPDFPPSAADRRFAEARLAGVDLTRLTATAARADEQGELHADVLALLHRHRWLRMLAPQACGGGEWPLPDVVRLEEAVAGADGSTGWLLTLCAGAAWFAGFWPPGLARRILATPDLCLAGSGAPTGVAAREGLGAAAGWRVTGQWAHASGSPLATHFTFNALLQDQGQPLRDAQGRPRACAFVLPAAQVQMQPSWRSIGLRASASNAFTVTQAFVPAEQAFDIAVEAATATGPLYRFPFGALAAVTLAANLLGLAGRFLAAAGPLIERRVMQRAAARGGAIASQAPANWQAARQALQAAREAFYLGLDTTWQHAASGQPVDAGQAQALEALSHALARTAREAVDAVYPDCGLHAADPRTELNRIWRDLHTATQHAQWLR